MKNDKLQLLKQWYNLFHELHYVCPSFAEQFFVFYEINTGLDKLFYKRKIILRTNPQSVSQM